MGMHPCRVLRKIENEERFFEERETLTGVVRRSLSTRNFDGVQYEPNSVFTLISPLQLGADDLIEWPWGSKRYWRVHASAPIPPNNTMYETLALSEDTVPVLATTVLIAGDDVLIGGEEVYF